jgi:hypothetical protein
MTNYIIKPEYKFIVTNLRFWHETPEGEPDYDKTPEGLFTGEITVNAEEEDVDFDDYAMATAIGIAATRLRSTLGENSPFCRTYGIAIGYIQEVGSDDLRLYHWWSGHFDSD